MQRLMIALVGLIAIGAVGCKSDCEVTCEEALSCPEAQDNAFTQAIDCGDACDFSEDVYDAVGCGDQFDDYYECGADHVDAICTDASLCAAQGDRLGTCIDDVQGG
jgi:hypothetical protein